MGKLPAFPFYPNDWARDLEEHPLEIEGAWIRICCKLWWSEQRGCLTKSLQEWSRILRNNGRKTQPILNYLLNQHIADGQYLDNQNITIISRRMVHDEKIRKIRQEVGKLGGNPGLKKIRENLDNQGYNQNSRPSISSSISSSNKEKNNKKRRLSDEEWTTKIKELYSWVNWEDVNREMDAWLLNHPGREKTRRFVTNWLIRKQQDKPILNPSVDKKSEYEVVHGRKD